MNLINVKVVALGLIFMSGLFHIFIKFYCLTDDKQLMG